MNRCNELHPDDLKVRRNLFRQIRHLRVQAGMSQVAVARAIGVADQAVARYERCRHDPLVARLQQHFRAIGWRLVLTPKFDPQPDPSPTQLLFTEYAQHDPDPDQADMWHRSATLHHLIARRHALGWSARHVSRLLTRSESLISTLEQDIKPQQLSSFQRYARALGGQLDCNLQLLTTNHPEGETP